MSSVRYIVASGGSIGERGFRAGPFRGVRGLMTSHLRRFQLSRAARSEPPGLLRTPPVKFRVVRFRRAGSGTGG